MNSLSHSAFNGPNSNFQVESGVPVPTLVHRNTYPFPTMSVGDSFRIDSRSKVAAAASIYGNRHSVKFTVRREGDGGYRVWRIA